MLGVYQVSSEINLWFVSPWRPAVVYLLKFSRMSCLASCFGCGSWILGLTKARLRGGAPKAQTRSGRTARARWASRHKWLTKTRNEPQGGARVRKDGLLRFQARSAQLERATKLAAPIGWELSVFSSLFSTGRDWRSSIARKLRREKDCRCLGVRGLTSWLPTKHTWDCSYRLFPRLSPATSAPSIMSSGNNTQFKSLEEWARALSAPSQALPPFPGRWLLAVRLARFVFFPSGGWGCSFGSIRW